MRKLPGARDAEYSQLNERPPNNSGIGGFALVSEFCFSFLLRVRKDWGPSAEVAIGGSPRTYPLKYLFSSNVHQSAVELSDLADDALYLALVVAFDLASCSDCQVQRELDPSHISPSR